MRNALSALLCLVSCVAFLLVPVVATSLVASRDWKEREAVRESVAEVRVLNARTGAGDKSYEDSLRRALDEACAKKGWAVLESAVQDGADGRHAALAYQCLLRARNETLPLDNRVDDLFSAAEYYLARNRSAGFFGQLIVLLLGVGFGAQMIRNIVQDEWHHGHMMT